MERFNLIESKWIEVFDNNSNKNIFSIEDILLNDCVRIHSLFPEFENIVFVFLYNVAQTVVIKYGEFNMDNFRRFQEEHRRYFYLEDDEYPFMQIGTEGKSKRIVNLLPRSQGENNAVSLFSMHDLELDLCEKCSASAIMLYQWTTNKDGPSARVPIFGSSVAFSWEYDEGSILKSINKNLITKTNDIVDYYFKDVRGQTGFMWVDACDSPDNFAQDRSLGVLENSGLYRMWSICRKILLNGRGEGKCSMCGSKGVIYRSFILGDKFVQFGTKRDSKQWEDGVGWSHPFGHILMDRKSGTECGVLRCGCIDSFGSYDRYGYVLLQDEGCKREKEFDSKDGHIKVFGVDYKKKGNLREIVNLDLPMIDRAYGQSLYSYAKIINERLSKSLKSMGCLYDAKRDFYINTASKFYECLGCQDEERANSKFLSHIVRVARKMFERLVNHQFCFSPSTDKCSTKNYIQKWLNIGGKNMVLKNDYVRSKLNCRYYSKQIGGWIDPVFGGKWGNVTDAERKKIRMGLNRADGRIMSGDSINDVISEISEFYPNVYNLVEDLVKLLIRIEHDENNLFPVQCKNSDVSEERFLRFFSNGSTIKDRLYLLNNIVDIIRSGKIFKTNIDVLFSILFRANKDYVKHISCACFYKGVKNEE